MAYSGKYFPVNPKKYKGDPNGIVYRSLWERTMMERLDMLAACIEWSSEEIVVHYRSPLDKKIHRYFPDMLAKMQTEDGSTKTFMIEIKPHSQTVPPKRPKRVTKKYIRAVTKHLVVMAKADAARAFCADRGWEYQFVTEHNLYPKKQDK